MQCCCKKASCSAILIWLLTQASIADWIRKFLQKKTLCVGCFPNEAIDLDLGPGCIPTFRVHFLHFFAVPKSLIVLAMQLLPNFPPLKSIIFQLALKDVTFSGTFCTRDRNHDAIFWMIYWRHRMRMTNKASARESFEKSPLGRLVKFTVDESSSTRCLR